MQTPSAPFHKTDAKHRAHSWSRNLQKTPLTMLALPRLLGGPYSIVPVSDASLLPIKLNGRTFTAQAGSHSHPISFISILSIHPSLSPSPSQSTKVLNLVMSSNISCRSPSVILFVRLGINVLASSALSQHKLAATAPPAQEFVSPSLHYSLLFGKSGYI